jgi:hypothetical protein
MSADVLSGRIHLPARGAWWASLQLDSQTAPAGAFTVSFPSLSLSGAVIKSGVFCDVAHAQIVGGVGGLGGTLTPAAYQNAQLRDPLEAIMNQSGEVLSSTVNSSILSVQLNAWTLVASTAARAIDELCGAAAAALGQAVTWRVLSDGTIWLGQETWPSQELPDGSDLLDAFPAEGRYVIGAESPSLLPGVAVNGIGNVAAVDHFITPSEVRSLLWLA